MSDLRTQAAVGVAWTAAQKWAVRLAGLAVFVLLSRLLSPREVGLAALALAVIAVTGAMGNLGATSFLVQADEVGRTVRDTVFYVSAAVALALAGTVFLLAGPLSAALDTPGLRPLVQALAPAVLLNGLTAVPTGLLQRELRFRSLAVRETVATLAAAVAGVALALAGAGVWALIAQALVQAMVGTVLVWVMVRWRPGLSFSRTATRALLSFGVPLLLVNVLQSLRDRTEQFLLGTILGLEALGVWTVAVRLLGVLSDVSIAVLDVVALPVLKAASADRDRFRRAMVLATRSSQLVLAPGLLVLAVGGPVLVPLAFGSQWEAAVLPAQVLCLGYAIAGLAYFNRPALLSHGRPGIVLGITALQLALHLGVVVVCAPFGLVVLAVGGVVETVLFVLGSAWVLDRTLGVGWSHLRRAAPVLVAGVVCGGVGVLMTSPLIGAPVAVVTLLSLPAFAALCLLLSPEVVREALDDLRRVLTSRRRPPGSPPAG